MGSFEPPKTEELIEKPLHPGLVYVNIGASNHTTELLLQLLKHLWRCKTPPDNKTYKTNDVPMPMPYLCHGDLNIYSKCQQIDSEKKKNTHTHNIIS